MSSHHIVREKQEPALFILSLYGFDEELLGQLLEWSPTLLVVGNLYEQVASMGIKIDVVIVNELHNVELQEGTIIKTTSKTNVLKAGINYFINNLYPAVNLICANFNLNEVKPFVNSIDLVVFANNKKYYPIKTGFSKWSVANLTIQVIGNIISYRGLKKIYDDKFVTLKDGFYSFVFNQDCIFIAEEI